MLPLPARGARPTSAPQALADHAAEQRSDEREERNQVKAFFLKREERNHPEEAAERKAREASEDRVAAMAEALVDAGPVEIALADTIGVGDPAQVARMVRRIGAIIAPIPVRVHFHNTRNTGLANVWAAVEAGASIVDASLGGLGGCPFAPGAAGNVPSEDVIYMLERAGIDTHMDLEKMINASRWLSEIMDRKLPGMVAHAPAFPAVRQGD